MTPRCWRWAFADENRAGRSISRSGAAGAQQLKIVLGQRFADVTRESLVAQLKFILTPEYLTQAQKIAAQMISPHESASLAADLAEEAAHAGRIA